MGHYDVIQFYLALVSAAKARGIRCAITSGMACVAYEVAEATKDCDLLCDPEAAADFLALLAESPFEGAACRYRGNISPPLDARWHKGGWTSHFEWPGSEAYLDVFGIAPRARSSWLEEMQPPYVHPHVVADMKRTGRDKDWPFISALGVKMVEKGDERGWLHVYELDSLRRLMAEKPAPPAALLEARPLLKLVATGSPLIGAAARLERSFWQELSDLRVRLFEKLLRSYVVAMRKATAGTGRELGLHENHKLRVECAEQHLPPRPLTPDVLAEFIAKAKESVLTGMTPEMGVWLPDVNPNFTLLIPELK
ncbi:MAG: hypothetical protein ACKVY0_10230 [Prosthecobacter sp.]|uniref:hypothetical protein n=1 Tax=Prosthecobacter sp. TaxID=1965333 RepID=UPI0039010A30